MTGRDKLIEAALNSCVNDGTSQLTVGVLGHLFDMALDAVEPLIRADERERAEQSRYVWVPSQREILADLRAKISSMPVVDRESVLALLDGATDD